jgi:hypothetical protein
LRQRSSAAVGNWRRRAERARGRQSRASGGEREEEDTGLASRAGGKTVGAVGENSGAQQSSVRRRARLDVEHGWIGTVARRRRHAGRLCPVGLSPLRPAGHTV